MDQVVAPDMKALMRRLLVRHPVDRASFDEFFNSQALNNSKFSVIQDSLRKSGNRERDLTPSVSLIPEDAMPVAQRTAPPIPGADGRKMTEQHTLFSVPNDQPGRVRTRLSVQEKTRVAQKEKGSGEEEERKSGGNFPVVLPTVTASPRQITQDLPSSERERKGDIMVPVSEAVPQAMIEPKGVPINGYSMLCPFILNDY